MSPSLCETYIGSIAWLRRYARRSMRSRRWKPLRFVTVRMCRSTPRRSSSASSSCRSAGVRSCESFS